MRRTRPLFAFACAALLTACSEERASAPAAPVYDVDVAPILQARCVTCHGDTNPAGGWSATSFLGAIACVAPSKRAGHAPARRPGAHSGGARHGPPPRPAQRGRAGHPRSLGRGRDARVSRRRPRPGHRRPAFDGLSRHPSARVALVADARRERPERVRPLPRRRPRAPGGRHPGGAGRALVHELPRPAGRRARVLDVPRIGRREPTRRAIHASSPATSPGRMRRTSSLRPIRAEGLPCSTCHPVPGATVIGGLHGDGTVEVTFDSDPGLGPGELRPVDRGAAPCLAMPRAARSRRSRGPRRRRPSDAAIATVRPRPATTRAPAPTATRRPMRPEPR